MTDNAANFKDFTRKRRPVYFMLGDEKFDCAPALPVETTQMIVRIAKSITDENALGSLNEFFAEVLLGDGAERIRAAMADKTEPLETTQATEILYWLLEVYGLRPTQPSSDSSSGSETGGAGTPSTDGASVAGSTLLT
jgi:hypothetical protein